ncbi:PHP domain-containing protein [Gardnerella vaginalis]|uniref:PHP domain-containing protein n=1 Tax=Gardnerella vaginalis TaxID=2702 RepID=UPI0039F0C78D
MTVVSNDIGSALDLDNASASTFSRNRWDLHCHTVYSDGTATPEDLVSQAKLAGLQGVAITDHDTTAGWEDFRSASKSSNMPVIFGSEITAEDSGVFVHMLAYQYNPQDSLIVSMFALTRKRRFERTKRMVEKMSHDFPITWDDVLSQAKLGDLTTIGRPHIADALVKAGVFQTRSEAFAGPVSTRGPYYIPTPSPNVREVIDAVKHAGGVVVIAHPADPQRNRVLLSDAQIISFAAAGLDGLEVYHRGNSKDQRQRLLALAQKCDLLVTGGSDWHGSGKPNRLGEETTNSDVVSEILSRGYKL